MIYICLKICLSQGTELVIVPDPIHGHRVIRSINGAGSRFVKDFIFLVRDDHGLYVVYI